MSKELAIAIQTKICFLCGKQHKDDSAIFIDQRFCTSETKVKREAEMSQPSDYGDCNQCKEYKEQGVFLIGFDESKTDFTNMPMGAFRTGEFLVMKDSGINNLPIPDEFKQKAIEKRVLFIPTELAQKTYTTWIIIE